ncbi:MAG: hypothetical protein NC453_12270 [Muribaculum sp.]|nr:hypothetical protein [Muribaculum sp.]
MIEVDEDGIVLYDSTDDLEETPAEPQDSKYMEAWKYYDQLLGDQFTDEKMAEFARKEDARMARIKRKDRLVSAGVIAGCIGYVAALIAIFF